MNSLTAKPGPASPSPGLTAAEVAARLSQFGPNAVRKEHAHQVAEFEALLRALAPAEVAAGGIKTEVDVLEDLDTAKAICAAAERFNADVVCIGGHTRPGFTAKILGSVALGVLTQCRRPVLIVWPPAE